MDYRRPAMRRTVLSFTTQEIKELLLAWSLISLAFAIVFSSGIALTLSFALMLVISLLTVGLGFVAHELSHKVVAIRYGCTAEFHAYPTMLFLAVIMSFFGFVFAAPGAVMISGAVTKKQHGHIALAGPLSNLILALLFLPFAFIIPQVGSYGASVNAFLALFNLLPIPGFDGVSVWRWHKGIYVSLFVLSMIFVFFSYFLPSFS